MEALRSRSERNLSTNRFVYEEISARMSKDGGLITHFRRKMISGRLIASSEKIEASGRRGQFLTEGVCLGFVAVS